MPPPNVVGPDAQCFCPVRLCVRAFPVVYRITFTLYVVHPCVRPETIVNTMCCGVFDTFSPNITAMHYGTNMNASQFGVKRSKVKVMVE